MSLLSRKPFGKNKEEVPAVETDQYIDLGAMYFEEEASAGGKGMIKLAEIYRYEDLSDLTQPVYEGNILILDYANIANDTDTLKRITSELKAVARDTNGDVAAIGHDLIIVTPRGLRIDRNKVRGGFR
ncbi:MAG: cell division protein SepF [Methanomassiliicoccus sp.]|nr:cell division protein SepF [Methanomassiliicoccus sp.]